MDDQAAAPMEAEVERFLSALGQALHPERGSDQHPEAALRALWRISPLSAGKSGHPLPDRRYDTSKGEQLRSILKALIHLLESRYPSTEMAALFQAHPDIGARSHANLRAISHPQQLLRPFDALHTIGRVLLPLPLLNVHRHPELLDCWLKSHFDLPLLERAEKKGKWSKSWYVGLLSALMLNWRWHGEISVSAKYPGWFDPQPLFALGDNTRVLRNGVRTIELDIRFPGSTEDLVSEEIGNLPFIDLVKKDYVDWSNDQDKVQLNSVQLNSTIYRTGPLPDVPAPPSLAEYGAWHLASLGLYRGASDGRLHDEGEELSALARASAEGLDSFLHGVASMAALPERLREVCSVLPGKTDTLDLPGWATMMRTLLAEHRSGLPDPREERFGGENRHAMARYPLEGWGGSSPLSPAGVASQMSLSMPHFRTMASLLWMLITVDPERVLHPSERPNLRARTVAKAKVPGDSA